MRRMARLGGLWWLVACGAGSVPPTGETGTDTAAATTDTSVPQPSDTAAPSSEDEPETGGDTAASAPTPVTQVGTADATNALTAAVPGLLFLSESESAVDVVVLTDPTALPSVRTVADLVAPIWTSTSPPALADREVEVRDLAAVFDPLTVEQPWWDDFQRTQAAGWSAVRATMASLDGARVWRIGRGIGGGVVGGSIEVYVLGGTAEGDVVGVHFVAVET
jgi:hypothetical protein